METPRAKIDTEAKKYRLQVRLALIVEQTKADGASTLLAQARSMRADVDAVRIVDGSIDQAQARLAEIEPHVLALQAQAGVEEYGLALMPKWMKLAAWSSPVIVSLGVIGFVFERRRRKRAVAQESLDALDAAGSEST